jgi:hypothetical protein
MFARTDTAIRRALMRPVDEFQPASAAQVFTHVFLNASLLQLAICSPPRQAATTRRYSEVYITELGAKAGRRAAIDDRQAGA